jgi:hypothetical protein
MRDKIATLFAALLMVAAPVGVVAATQTAAHAATNGVQYSFSNNLTNGQLSTKKFLWVQCDGGAEHLLTAPTSSPCFHTAYIGSRSPGGYPVGLQCYVNGAWTMFGQQVQWVGWRSDTINCRTYVM